MNSSTVLNLFEQCGALLRGHFALSNGLHTDMYLECALALQDARRASELGEAVAELFKSEDIDRVVAPGLGGILVGHEVARSLGEPFAYSEVVNGRHRLRRGFSIAAGERVLIVDDVLTAQTPLAEIHELVANAGGIPIGVGVIVDRAEQKPALPVPIKTLVQLNVVTYPAEDCPLCRTGVPIDTIRGGAIETSGK